MSDIATELVWSQSKSSRGSRLVMLALARLADDRGHATATTEEIALSTRLTDRAVRNCVNELSALGELTHQRGGGPSNPNRYSILLHDSPAEATPEKSRKVPKRAAEEHKGGTAFPELPSGNTAEGSESRKSAPSESEDFSSRARGGNTPYGSITTTKDQASLLGPSSENQGIRQEPVQVPDGAKDLVTTITNAGMLVGWRLTESEWDRVTALSECWGNERLVDVIARRWNPDRPPQSARYLLRIWADLPSHAPAAAPQGNVVPLRRQVGGWAPFQNTAEPSAYQNGF